MANKLDRKVMPANHTADDFEVMGRAARDQGDFGTDVGVADCACVNQFGEANNSKYYHGAVVKSRKTGAWFVYLEWGRIFSGQSWNGGFHGQDFQFVECSGEADARAFFAKQLHSKNTKRLEQKMIAGVTVWAGKAGDDGYIVQSLATREKGLPDCYKIKDNSGVTVVPKPAAPKAASKPVSFKTFQPQVVKLASDLVGGVITYTKALSAASGVTPTMDAIKQVRDGLIPAALQRIKMVGGDMRSQCQDTDLVDISKMVAALVPRPIPRSGMSQEEAILNGNTMTRLQQDLDAFEASLKNEDFEIAAPTTSGVDPDSLLNANLVWLDTSSVEGRWVFQTYMAMSNNRHANVRGMTVKNIFAVYREDRDARFRAMAEQVALKRKGQNLGSVPPGLQPRSRPDMKDIPADVVRDSNLFLGIHGTRGVNISPILASHFRMPKSLTGVHITGAAFGDGIYMATDRNKSAQYVGSSYSVYGSGGGIANRGHFMFLCDTIGGKFLYPKTAWTIGGHCPDGCDTVYAHPSKCLSLQNDEHVLFHPDMTRIRYLVEVSF